MNIKFTIAITVLIAITAPAFSETPDADESPDSSHSYIGVKSGLLSINNGLPWSDDGVMLGILYGYDFPDNGWAFEGEFNTTVSKPTSKNERYSDLGVTTLAGYGVYKTPGRFYLKAKMGLLYEYFTSSVSGAGTVIDVDGPGMAISLGLGGGIKVTDRLSAEVEYTSIDADVGYASLGLNWVL